jgi:hypothetical protein
LAQKYLKKKACVLLQIAKHGGRKGRTLIYWDKQKMKSKEKEK